MKTWMRVLAGTVAGVVLVSGTAFAQAKPTGCDKAGTPEKLEGQVVKVDPDQGKMTVRTADGTTHEFQASKETLQDYKVGDPIKAKRRSAPKCDK
jgi:hypothetical protein